MSTPTEAVMRQAREIATAIAALPIDESAKHQVERITALIAPALADLHAEVERQKKIVGSPWTWQRSSGLPWSIVFPAGNGQWPTIATTENERLAKAVCEAHNKATQDLRDKLAASESRVRELEELDKRTVALAVIETNRAEQAESRLAEAEGLLAAVIAPFDSFGNFGGEEWGHRTETISAIRAHLARTKETKTFTTVATSQIKPLVLGPTHPLESGDST